MIRWQFPKFPQYPQLQQVHIVFMGKQEGNLSYEREPFSLVQPRRQELWQQLQVDGLDSVVELKQVHGSAMVWDNQHSYPQLPEADGHSTAQVGVGLLIKTADCQPVFIVDIRAKYLLALHVGWRGNRSNFIAQAVHGFCDNYDLKPTELLAVRGPSLGPERAEFVNFAKEWPESFSPWLKLPEHTMDLWALTKWQLQVAGILPEYIYGVDLCTHTLAQDYFSHRADANAGRQASLIWIKG